MVKTLSIGVLVVFLYGCAYAVLETPESLIHGQYWISPDRTEVLVVFREVAETYYFNNNESRLCYTYKIKGKWRRGEEYALLRSEDGRAMVGVLLYSALELQHFEGADLVERAAKLITRTYEQSFGLSLPDTRLEPFQSPRPGTRRWTVSWTTTIRGRPVLVDASKIFVELAPGWVAQITVQGTSDDDALARHLLETLSSTSNHACYWPFLRQHMFLPEVH